MLKKQYCLACGNNQINHTLACCVETVAVLALPANLFLARSPLATLASYITDSLLALFVWFYRMIGLLKKNTDPTKTVNERGRVLWAEAGRRGILMHNFLMLGKPVDLYGATVKGRKIYFNGLPRPKRTPKNSEWWADDKYILKLTLQKAGVPVANGGSFSDFRTLMAKFKTLKKPVIIKPRLGSRGRHTTTNINTEEELRQAFDTAKQLCRWVILEEHLVGSVYRATMIGGKLAGILRGDPPRVTGDGIHTVAELVELKNKNKHSGIKDVVISEEHIHFLQRLGLSIQNILPVGKTVDLLEKIGVNYGGCAAEVTGSTHPEIKRTLEKAAQAIGDPLVGFDFIIEHISEDPSKQKWGIIEANGLPFINLHYDPIEGQTNNVAKPLWDYVEANIGQF